ncbi:hypothetical protein GWI33_015668 [Rhynchophorus ferrugineus]|uniref:Beta-mannosidase B n=1 Tax=Rhynchophorus ferrugineus TaxID=354439 RepID=A0A834I2Y6_RHYFE|nr:hypothetical protein GWI33_015668 [Rhynchophorus ferrugineus]
MASLWVLMALAASLSSSVRCVQIYSLDGQWEAYETNVGYKFEANVPGGAYTDLMNVGIIQDVFFGYNDNSSRWVGYNNWSYTKIFDVTSAQLGHNQVNLVFEGLDTFAEIIVNDVSVGTASNMFVRHIFDVREVLQAGTNNITVFFENPVEVGQRLYNEQVQQYRIPPECPDEAYRGECHVNMLRKMQASFSWDWGPAFPSVGIWKSVYLELYDLSAIRYVLTDVVEKDENTWSLKINTYFAGNDENIVRGTLNYSLTVEDGTIAESTLFAAKADQYGEITFDMTSLDVPKDKVKLWWPNEYGSQPLYELVVRYGSVQEDTVDEKRVKIGFRTVELVQDDLDNGATFYLKVNGVPIFAKGSNEIPINILPELGQDKKTIRNLMESSRDVHMNMLRVWGGGVYESDYFYEVADELGIMIWQDFMFACALYPVGEDYLESVKAEVNHNVKRIYSHPSIVVYSGNNENEGALVDSWYNTNDNYDLYKRDYVKLYIDTIKTEFDRITDGRGIFVSSSPSNGKETETEGWVSKTPGSSIYGDVHYYNYVLDPWSSTTYPVPRFCSEYGYQSLPFEATWRTATNDSADLDINSAFMDYRQHHPQGNDQMQDLILQKLNIPSKDSQFYTSAFIYLSQVLYSQAIRVETEHYRRYRSYLNDAGEGYTMGALYWQLNDVWVAPTWSSIDYTGRWKMLHYLARDMFSPIIVTAHIGYNRNLQLYTVNDELESVQATLVSKVFKYDSADFKPISETRTDLTLNAAASQLIEEFNIDDHLTSLNCGDQGSADQNCFYHFVLEKDGDVFSPQNYLFPGKLKDSNLPLSTVKATSISEAGTNTFDIVISSDNIAIFVWLDVDQIQGRFSHNGFLLVESSKTVSFSSEQSITLQELQEALTVTHLKDPRWL